MMEPTVEIKKDGKHLLHTPIYFNLFMADDRFGFNGFPVEITITLPSGHSETWTENAPDLEDYDDW